MAVVDLNKCVGYVSALVNAADWVTVTDGVTTATSSTVTSATAAFTQADRGKYISIANGLSTGNPLVGVILTVTNATTIVLDVNAGKTLTLASITYGGVSEDPRHPLWKLTNAVLQKDIELCNAILKTPNHPRRNFFTFAASSPITQTGSGVPMPSHSGEILMLEIKRTDLSWKVGKPLPQQMLPKLITWINNESSLFSTGSEGYYTIANGQIYFTGSAVRVTSASLTPDPAACQAPQEYQGAVALLAAADIFLTEGDDLNASQLLAQLGAASVGELIGREVA